MQTGIRFITQRAPWGTTVPCPVLAESMKLGGKKSVEKRMEEGMESGYLSQAEHPGEDAVTGSLRRREGENETREHEEGG